MAATTFCVWLTVFFIAPVLALGKPLGGESKTTASIDISLSNKNAATSGKVGLGWIYGQDSILQQYATNAVSWYVNCGMGFSALSIFRIFTWSPDTPDPMHEFNMAFMPELWGTNQVADFEQVVTTGYASYVLGFNE